jgi:rubrerythrin
MVCGKGKKQGEDIMEEWKCGNCGYTVKAETPPEQCPSCKEKCEFVNVTCYIPDCGSSGKDGRL